MLLSHGALHAGYQVYSSHGWFLSRIIELSNWFIFTRRITESYGFIVPNLRIGLFSHGESRRVTVLLSRDLSFGPTDQREVICELSNFFLHTENRGGHGLFTRVFFLSRIIEFANWFRHAEGHGCLSRIFFLSRDLSFGPTDQREVICELSIFSSRGMSRMVVEVMRVEL